MIEEVRSSSISGTLMAACHFLTADATLRHDVTQEEAAQIGSLSS